MGKEKPLRGLAGAKLRDEQILSVLAGGNAGSALIAARTGAPRRTVQYRLQQLRARGLVSDAPGAGFRLTGAGHAHVLESHLPKPTKSSDREVLSRLPAEHRAMVRLILDTVVARRSLAALHRTNWPGFVILGPSKTGKTLVAQIVCGILGIDPTVHIRLLPRETAKSIWGRRVPQPGGWRFEPASLLAQPLVAFDELDKAPAEVQRAAHAYLQGDSAFVVEGDRAEVRATPLVLLNQESGVDLLPEAYLRRSVVLDTNRLLAATTDIDEVARALLSAALPTLLEDVSPPEPVLPESARKFLRKALQACLTDLGWRRVDVESLARIGLGRWAREPQAGAECAALDVAADYLLCTTTRPGEVEEAWPARLGELYGDETGQVEPIVAARERAAEERALREAERKRLDEEGAAIAGKRAQLRALIDHAVRSAPRGVNSDERRRIADARGRAGFRRGQIGDASGLEELSRLESIVQSEVLDPLAEIERTRAAAQEAERQAKGAAKERARAEREAKRRVDVYVAELQALYSRKETAPGEDVLRRLMELRVVDERRFETPEETTRSVVRRWVRRAGREMKRLVGPVQRTEAPNPLPGPYGTMLLPALYQSQPPGRAEDEREYKTKVWTGYVSYDGKRYAAVELREWGSPNVQAVLRAAAAALARRLREPRRRAVRHASTVAISRRRRTLRAP